MNLSQILTSFFLDSTLDDRFCLIGRRTSFSFLLFAGYLIFGAFIFRFLEFNERDEIVQRMVGRLEFERSQFLEVLWAESMTNGEENWIQIANKKMDIYEWSVRKAALEGIELDGEGYESYNPWALFGSFYYSYTVITTIGYGNVYPTSTLAKLTTILYGIFGIPLTLLYLSHMGRLLTLVINTVLHRKWESIFDRTDQFDFTILVTICLIVLFHLAGAVLFYLLENDMSFVDSVYLVFITVSTIGFGDLTPTTSSWLFLVQMTYSLITLSLCSMCFVSIQTTLELYFMGTEGRFHEVNGDRSKKLSDMLVQESSNEEEQRESDDYELY